MGPAFFLDAPIILALPIDKLLSLSLSLHPYYQGYLIATFRLGYRGATVMPLASVTEAARLSDLVEVVPYWTPLCQLLILLLVFIMKKEINPASKDGGSRNGK